MLYVGKSVDLRSRVKSYFYGDGRKKVEDLLAETSTVDGVPCGSELESLILEARLIRQARAEVQPPGQDVAEVRVPADRRRRGVPADQGRPRDQGRRRVPRAVPLVAPRASGQGGARGRLPDPPLHHGDARVHAVRAVRARRDAPMPDPVRRARRPRALRGARPLPDLLPLHTGRAPRNARGAHARPRRAGTVRGGGARARPLARARRGAGTGGGSTAGSSPATTSSSAMGTIAPSASTEGRWRAVTGTTTSLSATRASASGRTSSRRSVRGSSVTRSGSRPPTSRSSNRSTAARPCRGSWRPCAGRPRPASDLAKLASR